MFCADFGVGILLASFDWKLQKSRIGEHSERRKHAVFPAFKDSQAGGEGRVY